MRPSLSSLLLAGSVGLLLFLQTANAASEHRAGFSIRFQDLESDLNILTTAVMPNAVLRVATTAEATADQGILLRTTNEWHWTAPAQPGLATLTFAQESDTIRLNVFILTPFRNGVQDNIEGYRIGRYAMEPFRALNAYRAPQGFINMAHAPAGLQVSPRFTIEQFLCKQQPGHDPVFLLLRAEMLAKLELLLDAANANGWPAKTFHIMSAFRTPYYNRAIGNDTDSSRHLYGGAADIWIDEDGDGQMDDLNRDGRINKDDARALAKLAESVAKQNPKTWLPGGIGIYRANSAHGPFVHIDARGYTARWE